MGSYHALILLSIFLFLPLSNASDIKLEPIPNSKQKQGIIHQVFRGTIDEVWSTIMDIEHYSDFMPKNKKTTILKLDKNHVRYRALVNMPWPVSDVEYDCDVFPMKDLLRINFQMVEGSGKGVKTFYGHWAFKKLSEKETRATYVLVFESGKKYPQWAENMGLKSTLGQVMKNVQERINWQRK
jgi:ribosome-associated toxin RatA of RatAB toxin-antitoxin module